MRFIEIIDVHTATLTDYPGNARVHDDQAMDESATVNGQYRAVVARRLPDGTLQILAGHGTRAAFARQGAPTVRVEVIEADDREARRINLADNASSRNAGYDDAALLALLDDASRDGGLPGTGWDADAYRELLDAAGCENPYDGPGATPEDIDGQDVDPPADPVTRSGDVWVLGDHRLICGDSTDPKTLDAVMGRDAHRAAYLVLTDPPYGVSERTDRKSKDRGKPFGDGTQRSVTVESNDFEPVFGDDEPFDPAHLIAAHKNLILFGANYFSERLPPSPSWIIWDKLDGLTTDKRDIGFDDNADVELAWTNLGGPARILRHRWKGLMKGSEHGDRRVHPTQKPVAIMREIIEWRTEPGQVVLDPYAGSGPTLLACELTGRAGRGVELSPGYCDTIVRRWQDITGENPVLERTGVAWDFTAVPPCVAP